MLSYCFIFWLVVVHYWHSPSDVPTATDYGPTADKRVRVFCGICRETRYYSIHRGVTRIAGVVMACEACRHYYQKFKRQPCMLSCKNNGKWVDTVTKNLCESDHKLIDYLQVSNNILFVLGSGVPVLYLQTYFFFLWASCRNIYELILLTVIDVMQVCI